MGVTCIVTTDALTCVHRPELCPDGVVRNIYHPGEVWIKDNLDLHTPWTKVDLRRNATKRDMYKRIPVDASKPDGRAHGVETADLKQKGECLPIDHKEKGAKFPTFQLYTKPRPISKEKYDDLQKQGQHCSQEAAKFYRDLPCDGAVADSDDEGVAADLELCALNAPDSDSESDEEQ